MFSKHILLALLACLFASALAPLECMDVPDRYPNEYLVSFHKDHTLSQHFHTINKDLSDAPHFRTYSFGYQAKMDDETLEAVRRDGRVRGVEANRPVYAVEAVEVELLETPQWLLDRYADAEVA